ncbi:MAG: glycosyltransferase family 39 protein [Saprospirales bacterium]|nr:glycosyltransferase family 39 protein [Saprospirales bacterium]
MKNLSLCVVLLATVVLAGIRVHYLKWDTPQVAHVLTWDAFGYYLDLPGLFIYGDVEKLEWLPGILEKYRPTGSLYQVSELPNGNWVMKYLLGLSILYAPFFFIGHGVAGWLGYAQDGFSAPYALAICFGALAYAFLGLLLLRLVLRRFFSEPVAALVLLLTGLATNYVQYAAVDSAMTHGFLFSIYALALWLIVRWHETPGLRLAFFIGLVIGLACITRPTEGVMLFLPLLWQKEGLDKRRFFRQQPAHLGWAVAGGFLGILPQLLYWKTVTGGWIYDVGSKFLFFRPHWQVLAGWEKGWFVYTPVALLLVAGLLFLRPYPFRKAVLTFSLLNVWIIIAWADWRYGASYSCRALVQSYPVWALALGAVLTKVWASRLKRLLLPLAAFLVYVNLFQIGQYNRTILHYNDMNRAYYRAIFLNPNPGPLDMSLLDTDEIIRDRGAFQQKQILRWVSMVVINKAGRSKSVFREGDIRQLEGYDAGREQWLYLEAQVKSDWGAFDTWLTAGLTLGERRKRTACRMENGISAPQAWNTVAFYFRLAPGFDGGRFAFFAETNSVQDIRIRQVRLILLERKMN